MANIKLKNRSGTEKIYSGIKHIQVPSSTGEPVEFDLEPTLQEKEKRIDANGLYEITTDNEYDGLSKVTVLANVQPKLQVKSKEFQAVLIQDGNVLVAYNENDAGHVMFEPDEGYDGLEGATGIIKGSLSENLKPSSIKVGGNVTDHIDIEMVDSDRDSNLGIKNGSVLELNIDVNAEDGVERTYTVTSNGELHDRIKSSTCDLIYGADVTVNTLIPNIAMTYEYWQPNMVGAAFKGYTRPEKSYEGTPGDSTSTVGSLTLSEWFVDNKPDKISFTGALNKDGTVSIALKCYKGTAEITPYFQSTNTVSAMMNNDGSITIDWGSMAPLPTEWSTEMKGYVNNDGSVVYTEIHFYYQDSTLIESSNGSSVVKVEESKTVNLLMQSGDQSIYPTTGNTLLKVVVKKPNTLIADNIKKGVNIGGVVGTLVSGGGETEEITVDLSMADGDQVIIPSSGKSISKATVTKPDTLISANILNDVVIGGVTGTLDPNASKIAFIGDGWSDDDVLCENGFGVARIREHGIEIQIWSDASDCQLPLDDGYEAFFRNLQPQTIISNTSLCTRLAEFCEYIVTNKKNEFNSIFTGATKACFMDNDHPVDIPALTDATPATTDGFMSVLKNTLVNFPSFVEYGYMNPNNYGENLTDGGQIQTFSNAIMPFVWYPAVEDGEPKLAYYSLQDPTGTMTTYENGFKMYTVNIEGINTQLAYVNAVPGVGVTGNFIALVAGDIGWWSDVAQTIPAAFLQNMNPTWNGGDVSLVAGWNITTDVEEGTNTTEQMPEEYKSILMFEPNSIPLSEMDSYEKSIFAGVTKQQYKRLNQNHVSITFVLRNNSQ